MHKLCTSSVCMCVCAVACMRCTILHTCPQIATSTQFSSCFLRGLNHFCHLLCNTHTHTQTDTVTVTVEKCLNIPAVAVST